MLGKTRTYEDVPKWLAKADMGLNKTMEKKEVDYILLTYKGFFHDYEFSQVFIHADNTRLAASMLGSAYVKLCESEGRDPLKCICDLLADKKRQENE